MDGLEDVDINYKSFKMEHPFNVSSSGKVYFIIMFLSLFIFFMHNNSCYFFSECGQEILNFSSYGDNERCPTFEDSNLCTECKNVSDSEQCRDLLLGGNSEKG